MNLDDIEIKARIAHKHDELDELVKAMPEGLKKRMRVFMNAELRTIGAQLIQAQEERNAKLVLQCAAELAIVAKMGDLQELLPD